MVSRESDTWPRDAAIAALLAYCAVYCLNTAYGRLCLGVAGASASRYTPYVVLGLFGLYLYALSNPWRNLRIALVLVLLAFAMLGTRPLNPPDAWELKYLSDRKNVWRECYLTRHDIDECDALTHFQIDPSPEATRLQEKLDFLTTLNDAHRRQIAASVPSQEFRRPNKLEGTPPQETTVSKDRRCNQQFHQYREQRFVSGVWKPAASNE